MIKTGLRALLSHWLRNPLQLFTLLAGLALATALWSGVQAVNGEARASYDAAAQSLGEARFAQVTRSDGELIQVETYVALRRAGWGVSPVISGRVPVADGVIRLLGIDPLTAPSGLGRNGATGGPDLAGLSAGLGSGFATAATAARLAGVLEVEIIETPEMAEGTLVVDISMAAEILGQDGGLDRLIVAGDAPLGRVPLAEIAPGLVISEPQDGSDVARLTDSFHLNLAAFGLLSFAVGIFIVHGAIGLAFEQRRAMFRTLRALGMPLWALVVALGIELLVFALVAGAIGTGLGYLIAGALLPDVAATLRGLYGAEVSGALTLRPVWWISGMAISLGGTVFAASGAIWQLTQMPLLSVAQPRAWAMASRSGLRWQGILAGFLLSLSLFLGVFGQGLILGFALLGALLIGAALALPLVLDRVLALGQKGAKTMMAQWFWADTRQQLPGLSLALMALLLAMAANVGVSTMVSSFRLTFTGFLDQRLASELYVRADTPAQALEIAEFATPLADAVLPILTAQTIISGATGEAFGVIDHATYRDHWGLLSAAPDAWDALARGEGLLLNEQTARRAGLGVGDTHDVVGRTLVILGIYSDYGNPGGQVIVSDALFYDMFPGVAPLRFGMRSSDPDALRARLLDELGLPEGNIIHQAEIKAFSLGVFERTFTVTDALNVLTLAVAGFAILMSLLTLAAMRLPQLAPVWALGVTRLALGKYELLRALLLASLTALLALPLGLVLAWVLLAIINVEAFGWELPMFFFPMEYARLGGLALIAAALAALWPAMRLARTPPSALLKVFSNAR